MNSITETQGRLKFRYKLGVFYLLLGTSVKVFGLPFALLGFGFPARRITQIFGALLLMILLEVFIDHNGKLSNFVKRNKLLLFFFLFLTISFIWSSVPLASLKRAVRLWMIPLLIANIFMEEDPQEIFWRMLKYFCYIAVLGSLILIFVFPQHGRAPFGQGGTMWIGIFTDKNFLGFGAAIAGVLFLQKITTSKKLFTKGWYFVWLILSMFLLFGSNSATSIVCFIGTFSLILYFFVANKYLYRNKHYVILLSLIVVIITLFIFMSLLEETFLRETFLNIFLELIHRTPTFTGRTEQWPFMIAAGLTRPVFGFGLTAFWHDVSKGILVVPGYDLWWKYKTSHNGYIDMFIDLGLIGLITYLGLIINTIINFTKLDLKKKSNICFIGIFIMILIQNFYESTFLQPDFIWFSFLFIIITASMRGHKTGKEHEY